MEVHDPDTIYACSFTRAAAVELAGRDTGLRQQNIGTIHSLCYHAIGAPKILETDKDLLKAWNDSHPGLEIGNGDGMLDEAPSRFEPLMQWNHERACLTGRRRPEAFVREWEAFKADNDCIDFADMLMQAPDDIGAEVLFVDEAQDLTPLQWQIVRRWGAEAETFVVVGDDDQLLYQFIGADAATFLQPLPDDQKRHLSHSYRLPRAVHAYSARWIERLGDAREPKAFEPRDADGLVVRSPRGAGEPEALVAEVAGYETGTTMILASCGYLLRPIVEALKAQGVPYGNPYRLKRGDWNPIRRTAQRVLQYADMMGQWSRSGHIPPARYWWTWIEMLAVQDTLQPGAKASLRRMAADDAEMTEDDLAEMFTAASWAAMADGDLDWLEDNVTAQFRKPIQYPRRVIERQGLDALRQEPRTIIGTIHSTKGGQADRVYLLPDISYQAYVSLIEAPATARPALTRMFYVGMTRAREELHLCSPGTRKYVAW